MDKATILAAIEEAKEQQALNFQEMKNKGSQIAKNRLTIKDKENQIATLRKEIEGLGNKGDNLISELTRLKVKEGSILGTKAAFKKMLDAAQ